MDGWINEGRKECIIFYQRVKSEDSEGETVS